MEEDKKDFITKEEPISGDLERMHLIRAELALQEAETRAEYERDIREMREDKTRLNAQIKELSSECNVWKDKLSAKDSELRVFEHAKAEVEAELSSKLREIDEFAIAGKIEVYLKKTEELKKKHKDELKSIWPY